MSTTFFGSPFEPIHLSGSDKKKLENIAQAILDVNFGRFVHFSGVDQNEWKLVKVQDQIKIYSGRERQRRKRYPFQRDQMDEDLQLVLCVGSIPGTLEDVLHTVLGWSSKGTIAKPSYMTDFSGAAVLASIKEPTIGNPFEALVVKWMELDVRRRSMGLVKNRDYVFVEDTGISLSLSLSLYQISPNR